MVDVGMENSKKSKFSLNYNAYATVQHGCVVALIDRVTVDGTDVQLLLRLAFRATQE